MSVSKLISLASNGSISSHSFFKRLIRLDLETLIWGSGYLTYSEILRQDTKFGEQPTNYTFTCSPLLNQAFFLCAFSLSFLNILSLKLFSFLSLSLSLFIYLPPSPGGVKCFWQAVHVTSDISHREWCWWMEWKREAEEASARSQPSGFALTTWDAMSVCVCCDATGQSVVA